MKYSSEIIETINLECEVNKIRLDVFLSEATGKSRSQISGIIDDGFVRVNGIVSGKSAKLKAGDSVEAQFPAEEEMSIEPENIPIDVIYDCDDFAVINKQAGLTVHPAPGCLHGTLVNALAFHYNITDDNDIRPGIVHRLDKDTSGLILVAKHRDAREQLSKLFQDREIDKRYLALCLGNPKHDHIFVDEPIGRSKRDRKMMAICKDGKHAVTEMMVQRKYKNYFLAEIRIHTGRTHQIRVHMKHMLFPLLGDETYGGKRVMNYGIKRQALHSWKLSFRSPFTGKQMNFEAPIPEDIKKLAPDFGLI